MDEELITLPVGRQDGDPEEHAPQSHDEPWRERFAEEYDTENDGHTGPQIAPA